MSKPPATGGRQRRRRELRGRVQVRRPGRGRVEHTCTTGADLDSDSPCAYVDLRPIIGRTSTDPRPMPPKTELLKGTLDMLILQTLTLGSLHGYAIAQHIARSSNDVLSADQGSLYPALERLQKKGRIKSRWGRSPTG